MNGYLGKPLSQLEGIRRDVNEAIREAQIDKVSPAAKSIEDAIIKHFPGTRITKTQLSPGGVYVKTSPVFGAIHIGSLEVWYHSNHKRYSASGNNHASSAEALVLQIKEKFKKNINQLLGESQ